MFPKTTLKIAPTALKLIFKQIEHYKFKILYRSGPKTFWSAQKNQILADARNKMNSRNKSISIFTFDFLTLNIQHHRLKSVMGEFLNSCFSGKIEEFWSMVLFRLLSTKKRLSFNKTFLKLAIKYLLENCYFTLDSMYFQHLIRVSMLWVWPSTFYGKFILVFSWKEVASFNKKKWYLKKDRTPLALRRRRVGDFRWRESLPMVPAGSKAIRLSSVNHSTKTIHFYHHHHHDHDHHHHHL